MIVDKPWGCYEVLKEGNRIMANDAKAFSYVVKIITVRPGQRLSSQKHKYRREFWTGLSGHGIVEMEYRDYSFGSGTSMEIPRHAQHRITNNSHEDLVILEVQSGICYEEDITRLLDDYGRAE